MGNHACERQTANERCARQQFVSICRARPRVELLSFGLEGRTLYLIISVSIAISLEYRDIANCVRAFEARNVCRAQVGYESN
eukprot:2682751-Pleurochrysis_carterae.AAC.1